MSETEFLLTHLGQDGRNHHRLEDSKMPNDTCHNLTTSKQEFQAHDDELEDDMSSAASFETCLDLESSHYIPAQRTDNSDATEPTEKISDLATVAEARGARDSFSKKEKTQSAVQDNLEDEDLPPSKLETKGLNQACSESNSGKKESGPPGPLLNPAASIHQTETSEDDSSPINCPQASGKISRATINSSTLHRTNEPGLKNLVEPYARFDKVSAEESKADLVEIDAGKAHNQGLPLPTSNQAFEVMKKMQCRSCKLYFNPVQNLHDLDNGSRPCSFHPGKRHTRRTKVLR